MDFLDKMLVGPKIREYISNIGWEALFFLEHPNYVELSLEFFTSFWTDSDHFKFEEHTLERVEARTSGEHQAPFQEDHAQYVKSEH